MNFFSAVAGNITVKTKRKSNLENYNFLLCFATSAFYYVIFSKLLKEDSILIGTKNVFSSSKIIKTKIKWLSFPSLLNIYWNKSLMIVFPPFVLLNK